MEFKKVVPLMLFILLLSSAGCKQGPEKFIVNTWEVTSVVSKGTFDDSTFQIIKGDLMRMKMSFKDNKYTMKIDGTIIETGTYGFSDNKLVITTEEGMNMDAVVTKDNLTLDTPDFMTTLRPN